MCKSLLWLNTHTSSCHHSQQAAWNASNTDTVKCHVKGTRQWKNGVHGRHAFAQTSSDSFNLAVHDYNQSGGIASCGWSGVRSNKSSVDFPQCVFFIINLVYSTYVSTAEWSRTCSRRWRRLWEAEVSRSCVQRGARLSQWGDAATVCTAR